MSAWANSDASAPSSHRKAPDLRAYVVTDPGCNAKWGRSNAEAVRAAVAGGAPIVQVREKDADGGATLQQVPVHRASHKLKLRHNFALQTFRHS